MRGLLLFLGACSFHLPGGQNGGGDGPPPNDGPNDGPPADRFVPPADGCETFSTQFDTCTVQFTVAVNINTDRIYNTDTHVLADFPSGANAITLDATQQIDIAGKGGPINIWLATTAAVTGGNTLRVVGSKPFGIVANAKITLDGLIDGSSGGGLSGAGSLPFASCSPGPSPFSPNPHVGGAAGAGGGAYQGAGGRGGDSDTNEGGEAGGPGGTAIAEPPGPRGGCPGAHGGNTGGSQTGGAGGPGGGAIYLVSEVFVELHAPARINAGGGGGGGGKNTDGGGGGGGSGGMIVLEAPQVKVDGTLAANGGGGGGGAGGVTAGGPGAAGQASNMAAIGGTSASNATPGVAGSAGALLNGSDNTAGALTAAGGGGGGGAGYISIVSANISGGGTISPPQTTLPP